MRSARQSHFSMDTLDVLSDRLRREAPGALVGERVCSSVKASLRALLKYQHREQSWWC